MVPAVQHPGQARSSRSHRAKMRPNKCDFSQANIKFAGPTAQGVLDPVHGLFSVKSLTFVLPQGPQGPCHLPTRSGPDWVNDPFSLWDPPLGPKVNLKNFPGPPLGPSFAPKHASRTLSRPSKKRSGRKMKSSKYVQGFDQNSLPGKLLPIQDPPKWPPLDLINFPEGSL